ncbi:MAG: pyridoxal phosphate-dependent aminotransferase [Sporolactobacillus sp.]
MQVSNLIQNLSASKTVSIQNKVFALQHSGQSIINLAGGEPDFKTPEPIIQAAEQAMERGFTHYVSTNGIPELREAIALKMQQENRVACDASQIIVTAGGKPALYAALTAVLNPDDEVLILNPAWVSYEPLVRMARGIPVTVDLDPQQQFMIDTNQLKAACTPRTKAIIVNNPNNPTGRVLTKEEIDGLKEIAIDHDLILISDEVYEKIVFDKHHVISLASDPELEERTITIQSFSKGQAMTGWRLGYAVLPKNFVTAAIKIQSHLATCTTAFIQYAGVVAVRDVAEDVERMRMRYAQRVKQMVIGLNEISGISCTCPEGAFYLFPKINYKGYSSSQFADYLLDEVNVAVTPGEAFGEAYSNYIRLSCATSDENLRQAVARIGQAMAVKAR